MVKCRSTFCPATNWDFTHCREVLWFLKKKERRKKGDLNKHRLNQGFVPNCDMFSILTFKQIALHVRNIYCEGWLMWISNYC